jgi:hypothetical protein
MGKNSSNSQMNNSAMFGLIQANKNTKYPTSCTSRIAWIVTRDLHGIRDFCVELQKGGFLTNGKKRISLKQIQNQKQVYS